ncbi:hypothetical protein ATY75_13100 [Rhizobium sp. N122]|nr:hypothetical protein ATY75_13100 [Rhizobium sp. N122]
MELRSLEIMKVVPCGPLIRPTGTFSPLGRRGEQGAPKLPNWTRLLKGIPSDGVDGEAAISLFSPRGEGGPKGRMRGPHGTNDDLT